MLKRTTYNMIEDVLFKAKRPLAGFEFEAVPMFKLDIDTGTEKVTNGRSYVGCSQSALERRLREMRGVGRVTSRRRDGEAFVEYSPIAREG